MNTPPRAKRPLSRFRSIVWLVVSAAAVWFGFWLLNLAGQADDPGAGVKALKIVFGIVWFVFWIGAMIYNALNYRAAGRAKVTD